MWVKRYAELIGNYEKQGIKSLCDNKLRLPSVFLADEVGALRTSYPYTSYALRSDYRKKQARVYNFHEISDDRQSVRRRSEIRESPSLTAARNDESLFALLYEPDNTIDWMT